MDSTAIQTKLQQINSLVAEVLKELPDHEETTNRSEPVREKNSQTLHGLFNGFNVHNPVHACYLLLCLKADSGASQNEIIKQCLQDGRQPDDFNSVESMRKAVFYLCKTKHLPKPWRDKDR